MTLTAIVLLAVLPACAMLGPDAAGVDDRRLHAPDPAEMLLTQAALRAERAFVALARARSAEDPLADTPLPRIVPAALLTPVTFDWTRPGGNPWPRISPGAPATALSPPDPFRPGRRSSPSRPRGRR